MGDNGRINADEIWLAGVDGCKAGWIAAFVRPAAADFHIRVVERFSDLIVAGESPAIIAVDIPIGLPDNSGRGGRAAENAVRPLLGKRQSSVFSVPSRAAVYAEPGPFTDMPSAYAAHRRCSVVGRETSDPPRGVSIQSFMIFPKIREVDACLREVPAAAARVFEVHPEVAFWRLNGEQSLSEPKKVKGRPYPPGMSLRRDILVAAGLPPDIMAVATPPGAGEDDLLDAFACAAIARRIHAGIARPFPDPPLRDSYGLPMAIWA
jgi:predicted RNase H-like nuclease